MIGESSKLDYSTLYRDRKGATKCMDDGVECRGFLGAMVV